MEPSGQIYASASLISWKSRRYPLNGRLGGFQSRYERSRDKYNVVLLSEFETQLLGCPVRSLVTIPNNKPRIFTDVASLFYLNQACKTRGPQRVVLWCAVVVIFSNFTALSEYNNKYFCGILKIFLPVKYSYAHSTPTYV
jgi:hypothetical protein